MTPNADRRLALGSAILIVAALAFGVGFKLGEPSNPTAASVDVGFLRDMIDHHDQAVVMASYVLRSGSGADPAVSNYAFEIIMEQRYEIGMMLGWLRSWGFDVGERNRTVMRWMDMPTSLTEMQGMQSPESMRMLEAARGRDLDEAFLAMMIDHHRGGIHMADYAARRAGEDLVRDLARRISRVQTSEIGELRALEARLGLPVS